MSDKLTLGGIVGLTRGACSTKRLLDNLEAVSRHHRIQASEGFRAAAREMAGRLAQAGLEVTVDAYPADLRAQAFTQRIFREWNCRKAWLEITAPFTLRAGDFAAEELSLIQRSAPGDFSGEDVEVVWVPDDADPSQPMPQLRGRVLFVENGFERWIDTVRREGAAAILTVSMPQIPPVRVDMADDPRLADAYANLSFHHFDKESEETLRGFVLTPRTGRRLGEACRQLAQEGRRPTVRFQVDASFTDGSLENVNAFLPGQTREEILLLAHLCHPRSCVNDNASGAAAATEAITLLHKLVEEGTLPRPRRGIRLLLIPEFTGTYAFLAQDAHRMERIRAGFNMDMIAGRQDGNAGAMLAVDTPDAAASFSGDLTEAIFDQLRRECAFGGKECLVPLFACQRVPFVFGSDHSILSDPTVAIPTVALTQWPDKTYHTSADDLAHVDPQLLVRGAACAASYCWTLANLTPSLMEEILPYTARRLFERADRLRREKAGADRRWYLRQLAQKTLEGYLGWFEGEELETARSLMGEEQKAFDRLMGGCEPWDPLPGPVPKRLFTAQLAVRSVVGEMTPAQRQEWQALHRDFPQTMARMDEIFYETDGVRSMDEIARQIRCRTGVDCAESLPSFFAFFRRLGLVEIQSPQDV